MKKLITSVALVLSAFHGFSQQDPQFSQNMYTRLSINPGFAGASEYLCATILNRQQWVGFDGAPKTTLVSVDAPIKIGEQTIGIGGTIMADKLGFESTFYGKLALAYRMPLATGNLGIGIDAGILNKSINGEWKAVIAPSLDPNIPKNAVSDKALDLGFGVHYHIPGMMYVGISATHLNAADLKATNLKYLMARHYYITGGYEYDINEMLKLRPNILVKTDFASTQMDINLNVLYNNMVWAGVSYRLQDAIVPMVGFQRTLSNGKGNYRIGYSYDVTTSQLKSYSNGTHELMLGFCYNITPPKKITRYKNVRFL